MHTVDKKLRETAEITGYWGKLSENPAGSDVKFW